MSWIKKTLILSLLAFLAIFVAGCGRTNQDVLSEEPEKRELRGIYSLYRMYIKNNQQPPKKLTDLKRYKAIEPTALRTLEEGKYFAVWDVKDEDVGTVLAYAKDAPTNGGWAVMADGTIKQLDASAFQNVPKPAK